MAPPPLPLADRLELERLHRLCTGRGPRRDFARAVCTRLARHAGADSFCFLLLDPALGLPVDVISAFGAQARSDWLEAVLLRTPLGDPGFLAGQRQRVQWAAQFVEHPADDPLMQRLLRPNGLGPMVCLSLSAAGRGWGYLHLLRHEGAADFDAGQRRFLEACVPVLVAELQRRAAAQLLAAQPGAGPGLLTLDPAGEVDAVDEACAGLLAASGGSALEMAVAVTMELVRRGIREAATVPLPVLPVVDEANGRRHLVRGRWMQGRDGRRRGAVVVEPLATLAEPALMLRLGFTPRECDVAAMTVRGLSTLDAGTALGLSPHTVEHHLGNVFAKLAVGSRAEMAALLLGGWGSAPPHAG